MIFVDTGYLIAVSDALDQLHDRAVAWSRAARTRMLTTEYVLVEAVNHFSHPADRPRVSALARWVRTAPVFEFLAASSDMLDAGLTLFGSRPDKAWSLTDCISFHVMTQRGITQALAHDHHFEQAGFEPLLRRDP